MNMRRLKIEIKEKHPRWAFLTHLIGETREPRPTMGVNYAGLVLVNPFYARQVGITKLVRMIRQELKLADDLAKNVRGFRSR